MLVKVSLVLEGGGAEYADDVPAHLLVFLQRSHVLEHSLTFRTGQKSCVCNRRTL